MGLKLNRKPLCPSFHPAVMSFHQEEGGGSRQKSNLNREGQGNVLLPLAKLSFVVSSGGKQDMMGLGKFGDPWLGGISLSFSP